MRAFFDTNVLIYAIDPRDDRKHAAATALLRAHAAAGTLVLSTQVLVETYNVLVRKLGLAPAAALACVEAFGSYEVVPASAHGVLQGLALSQRFHLSHWDGLIVQAALDGGCQALLSEDLQAGQRFGALEVVNPFAPGAHEALPAGPTAARAGRPRRSGASRL